MMKHLIFVLSTAMCVSTVLGTTFTVDDDGKADYADIQSAINAASNGDTILVSPGTYTSTGTVVIDLLGKEVTVQSTDGMDVTIIDGELARRGINCLQGETRDTIIDGFTIWRCSGVWGGGMEILGSSPTIQNCLFSQNIVSQGGGAIYSHAYCSPLLIGCTFKWNDAGSSGGAISNSYYSNMEIRGCTFSYNDCYYYGGAIRNQSYSDCIISDCEFLLNVSIQYGGAIDMFGSESTIERCTFTLNDASTRAGGAIATQGCSPAIIGCIFSENSGFYGGACISARSDAHPTFYNSMFCENEPTDFYTDSNSTVEDLGLNVYEGCPNACCVLSGCSVLTPEKCAELGGVFLNTSSCLSCPEICQGDLDMNGEVNVDDLLLLIGAWGICP